MSVTITGRYALRLSMLAGLGALTFEIRGVYRMWRAFR